MASLNKNLRKQLERTVAEARKIAVEGAERSLHGLGVDVPRAPANDNKLRISLRAHARQLGDRLDGRPERLIQAVAYEHWHRLLFARFLIENDLLLHPEHKVALSLDEVKELALGENREWVELAADYAQGMLLRRVFQPEDPALLVSMPLETRQQLETKLNALPREVFLADDSLGWVYQFWQKEAKELVNKSEVKIGADQLAPVTQLFTEDYMVLFLLENTLGAWWTARHGKPDLPGYTWTYLRLNEDGTPTCGGFGDWPIVARELRILDPCMGSGHFLTFALPILARMRAQEEGLSIRDSLAAVLRDNLFGLELDARCSQIAAFNLALTAWKLAGCHFPLPEMNLACSGLGINASEADWVKLAGDDGQAREEMRRLYSLFRDAPTLGSLIDPLRLHQNVFAAGTTRVLPLLEEALKKEQASDETRELVIAARGVLAAFRILAGQFTLVVTNVPYLGRGRQNEDLRKYCDEFHSDAAADLAACFIDRCLKFTAPNNSVAIVTKQEPLFLKQYISQRKRLLETSQWDFIARLGPRAFETITGERVNVTLLALSNRLPDGGHELIGWDVGDLRTVDEKAEALAKKKWSSRAQSQQRTNPDCRIVLEGTNYSNVLGSFATALAGHLVGDSIRFERTFWEVDTMDGRWEFLQSTVETTVPHGGRSSVIFWEKERGQMHRLAQSVRHLNHVAQNWLRGKPSWGKRGVIVSQMGDLPATLYMGQIYDCNCCAIVPHNEKDLEAVWAYCSSAEFSKNVRQLDQKMNVAPHTLLKVQFDSSHWSDVAGELYPNGLPAQCSNDPTQWIFSGHPSDSVHPLQVAVARLVGYKWPRQTGSSFADCPALAADGLEAYEHSNGILCLASLTGEESAADRLRSLLRAAYGEDYNLASLLRGKRSPSLEEWLRDEFFEEHCRLFHQRPFVWHIWDGRKDGFHILVNYHKLDHKALQKLIYSSLGDWIARQRQDLSNDIEGADGRLSSAEHLQNELKKILDGESPYDIFVRWKPLKEQSVGWNPDLTDGIRLNTRPWITEAKLYRSATPGILRMTPNIKYTKDRGKEPASGFDDFPWFKDSPDRSNDIHISLNEKRKARGLA